jgi:hypothetical protein
MRGVIVHVEHRIGWIAIRDDRGEITIAEILGGHDVCVFRPKPTTNSDLFWPDLAFRRNP